MFQELCSKMMQCQCDQFTLCSMTTKSILTTGTRLSISFHSHHIGEIVLLKMPCALFLFAVSVVPTLCQLYIRPLPRDRTFTGLSSLSTQAETVVDCVDQWESNPPKALVFNEVTKNCTAFRNVYGLKPAPLNERGYLITESDQNVCLNDTMDDLREIFDCAEGWHKLSFGSSSACFLQFDNTASSKFIKETGKTEFQICETTNPPSKPASIHSQEENEAIAKWRPFASYINIGLQLSDPKRFNETSAWEWIDGSALDYSNLDKEAIATACQEGKCKFAKLDFDSRLWRSYSASFPLCKYNLN